jgi:hypothetical protein
MVLESESKECMAKNSPAIPKADRVDEPLVGPGAGISAPRLAVDLVDHRIAMTATTRPVLFQPPFVSCMIGQMGLLV